jgi:superfamily II DNA or RNA helicase
MPLRPYQADLLAEVQSAWAAGARAVLMQLATGGGKCLGRGTPVLMFDGSVRPVEDVRPGDQIMGPDSTPRNVLSTCSGSEMLYRVTPTKGDPYVVNESHVLSLRQTNRMAEPTYPCYRNRGVVNLSVREYLEKSAYWKHTHKGWRAAVDFPTKPHPAALPAYFLGLWLGDGMSKAPAITTADPEVIVYLNEFVQSCELRLRYNFGQSGAAVDAFIVGKKGQSNIVTEALRAYDLLHNKHIPHAYKTGDREQRLQLLAGLMDSDGSYTGKGYDYITKLRTLADDVAFVARSLGFSAHVSPCQKSSQNGTAAEYYRLCISGDVNQIPCRVERKKAKPRVQKKSVLVTGIKVEPVGVGEYFGFEIDGDRLFLLGDFTVTHNTVILAEAVRAAGVPALLVAHRHELVSQISLALARASVPHDVFASKEARREMLRTHLKEFGQAWLTPSARVRVASVDTIVQPRRLAEAAAFLRTVRLWVVDECFPAGTLVDGRPIETLQVGDVVTSFNEETGEFEPKPITHLFRNPMPDDMVRVETVTDHVLTSTRGHPYYTRRGWMEAQCLCRDDEVLLYDVPLHSVRRGDRGDQRDATVSVSQDGQDLLHAGVRVREPAAAVFSHQRGPGDGDPAVLGVRAEHADHHAVSSSSGEDREPALLQSSLFGRLSLAGEQPYDDGDELRAQSRRSEQGESAQPGGEGEGVRHAAGERTFAESERRERPAGDRSGASTPVDARAAGLPEPVGCDDRAGLFAEPLQDRLRAPGSEDSDRSGREQPFGSSATATGRPEGCVPTWVGLASVSVLQRDDPKVAGDGHVYNIEVDGNHTYVAHGIVVHNCAHVVRDNKWGRVLDALPAEAHGLLPTATPVRADGKGLGSHHDGYADVMVRGPSMRWLIDEGYLSDYRVACVDSHIEEMLGEVAASGDWSQAMLKSVSEHSQITGDVVQSYRQYADGLIGLTFATDVETATRMARAYRAAGVPAEILTGETPLPVRAHLIHRLERRDLKQLCVVDVVSEGFDCLDSETEILTPAGWRGFDALKKGDDCYSFNRVTRRMEVTPIEAIVRRPAREGEKVVSIESQHTSVRVTEGHQFHYRKKNARRPDGMSPDFRTATARALLEDAQPFSVPISAELEGGFPGVPLTDDEIRLVAWYISDGCFQRSYLTISQTKPWFVEKIKAVLAAVGVDYFERKRWMSTGYNQNYEAYEFFIPKGVHSGVFLRKGWAKFEPYLDKDISPLLHQMDRRQFAIFYQTLMDGNGSYARENASGTLTCPRKSQADALTHMAVIRGFAAMYGTYTVESGLTIYNVRVRNDQWHGFAPKDERGARFTLEDPASGETFWCVQNRNSTLVTRRRGRVIILGNCPAVEVATFARPTASLGLYLQQFGRALRVMPGKDRVTIIDHVGNFLRHGPPDRHREWTLDRRDKRAKRDSGAIPLRVCLKCAGPYEKHLDACPHCGEKPPEPGHRGPPQMVEGTLRLLDDETLARLRADVAAANMDIEEYQDRQRAYYLPAPAVARNTRLHAGRLAALAELRSELAAWGRRHRHKGLTDEAMQRLFWHRYGITVMEAIAMTERDARGLIERMRAA